MDDEAGYGLVMPFTVCQSQGGPFDDQSFVNGYVAGDIDNTLRYLIPVAAEVSWWVDPKLLPQLDLIAMRHGYKMTSEPWEDHPDDYALATFKKALDAPGAT